MTTYLKTGTTTERVHVLALDANRAGVTSATMVLRLWRSSDGYFLDFADFTFKAAGFSSISTTMTEHSAVNNAGVYYADLPLASITNTVANDVYTFRVDQTGGSTTAVNMPAVGEVRVGRWVDTIETQLDAAVSTRATNAGVAADVWGTALPGAFGAGTAGARLDADVSSRAVAGDAMTLAADSVNAAAISADAVTELQAGLATAVDVAGVPDAVWGVALPGAFGAGTAGSRLDVDVSSRAAPGAQMDLVDDAVDAGALAASAVTELQAGLATSSDVAGVPNAVWSVALPGAFGAGTAGSYLDGRVSLVAGSVWDRLLSSHTLPSSFGLFLSTQLDVATSTRAAPGAAMDLVDDAVDAGALAASAVTELQAGLATAVDVAGVPDAVWGVLLPGAFGAGTAGARLDVDVSSRAAPGAQMDLVDDAVDAGALAASAVTELQAGLATAVDVAGVPDAVWSVALPGAFGAGTAGARLNVDVSSRAAPGAQMDLIDDAVDAGALAASAVTELQAGLATAVDVAGVPDAVWGVLLPGAFGVGTAGANLDVAVSSRATEGGIASAVWSTPLPGAFGVGTAGARLDVDVSSRAAPGAQMDLVDDAVDAGAMAASAVLEIQSGLATAAAVAAIPAAVWSVAQSGYAASPSSMGWALRTLRVLATNRLAETPGNPGTLVVYADDGTSPFLTYQLTDFSGKQVLGMVGAPARRAAAVVT